MKHRSKDVVLEGLVQHLCRFDSELTDHFICPICLDTIPVSDRSKISEAHIIPKSAGGSMWTLACSKCNSEAGTTFDKWFGEYVRLRQENKELFETKLQAKYFKIDGVPYGGKYGLDQDGGLVFYIHEDRTAPKSLMELKRRHP